MKFPPADSGWFLVGEEEVIGAIRAWAFRMGTDMGIAFLSVYITKKSPPPFIHVENVIGLHIRDIDECINAVKDSIELSLDLLNEEILRRHDRQNMLLT